jgi:two-component system, NarL family, nitrate/nitrite response regulator NarL
MSALDKSNEEAPIGKSAIQPTGPFSVVIVDDDPFFRAKIESWIAANSRFTCVASCEDGESGLEVICSKKPDIALVDFGLPDIKGDAVMWQAKERAPPTKVVAISGILGDYVALRALSARADGFLDKEDCLDPPKFFAELEEVLRGGCPLSERARKLVVRAWQACRPNPAVMDLLTEREREVAELLCLGLAEGAIAHKLGISVETVRWHVERIYGQLAVHCRADLQTKLLG